MINSSRSFFANEVSRVLPPGNSSRTTIVRSSWRTRYPITGRAAPLGRTTTALALPITEAMSRQPRKHDSERRAKRPAVGRFGRSSFGGIQEPEFEKREFLIAKLKQRV